jgi:hypothetical protein
MRYRLRTLLIVLAIGPPLLAGFYFLFRRDTHPLAVAVAILIAPVWATMLVAGPLLALDWLLKRIRR